MAPSPYNVPVLVPLLIKRRNPEAIKNQLLR
jgi:hypothetical protein